MWLLDKIQEFLGPSHEPQEDLPKTTLWRGSEQYLIGEIFRAVGHALRHTGSAKIPRGEYFVEPAKAVYDLIENVLPVKFTIDAEQKDQYRYVVCKQRENYTNLSEDQIQLAVLLNYVAYTIQNPGEWVYIKRIYAIDTRKFIQKLAKVVEKLLKVRFNTSFEKGIHIRCSRQDDRSTFPGEEPLENSFQMYDHSILAKSLGVKNLLS